MLALARADGERLSCVVLSLGGVFKSMFAFPGKEGVERDAARVDAFAVSIKKCDVEHGVGGGDEALEQLGELGRIDVVGRYVSTACGQHSSSKIPQRCLHVLLPLRNVSGERTRYGVLK